jgi:CBS domain-containing protein
MASVGTIINRALPLKWIPATATVIDAVKIMVGHDVGALPVLDDGKLVGVFSERDLMKRVIVQGLDPRITPVASVMTRDLATTDINHDHTVAMAIMTERRVRHLPVLEQGKIVGFISMRALMRAESDGKDHEIQSLTNYIHYVPPTAE